MFQDNDTMPNVLSSTAGQDFLDVLEMQCLWCASLKKVEFVVCVMLNIMVSIQMFIHALG